MTCSLTTLSVVPVQSTSTEAAVKAILERWILKHGTPDVISHDLGSGFTSSLWKAIMTAFDIKSARTTPRHSQANGRAEAQNRRINQCLRATLSEKEWKNYDLYIKYIVFCLNSLQCNRTGFSPNFLVYGRELRTPRDLFVEDDGRLEETLLQNTDIEYPKRKYAYDLHRTISRTVRKARDCAQARAKYMIKDYDKRVRGPFFEKNEWCMLLELYPKHKYSEKWRGPFKIIEKINDHNYIVEVDGAKKVVNITKMKKYVPNKYSLIQNSPTNTPSKAKDKSNEGGKTSKLPKRQIRTPFASDSSSDDITVKLFQPQVKRRSARIANKASSKATPEVERESSAGSANPDLETETTVPTDTATNSWEQRETPTRSNPVALNTSGTSEQEFFDAEEALMEAEMERGNVDIAVNESTPAHSKPANELPQKAAPDMTFSEIDTSVSLRDIEKAEENGKKPRKGKPVPPAIDQADTSQPPKRSNSRYNLRVKPAKRSLFGRSSTNKK